MTNKVKIDSLTEDQLRLVGRNMANGSDGSDAAKSGDWDGVRAALAEAVRDGYDVEDFLT